MFINLALKSLGNRKGSVVLTILAMAVSVLVFLGVEHIRKQAKESFANTVSGVDLIVGARTGRVNLLLYSVFRVGAPTNNIQWQSYQDLTTNKQVDWVIPISLGDSHKGYRVMGTTSEYFAHFKYGKSHQLGFSSGQPFKGLYDVVLGAEVAKKLGYTLGDKIILAHGVAKTSFSLHDNHPFTVTGILLPTGTPVDQTLHVSLQGIEAIHLDWQHSLHQNPNDQKLANEERYQPKQITAMLVGLKSRLATFTVQRAINESKREPLIAILPGVALAELWQMMGVLENTLRLVSLLVFIAALLGLAAMLLASMREREHEILLLRAIGASPRFLFLLIQLEALLISLTSFALGSLLLFIGLFITQDVLASKFGIQMSVSLLTEKNALFLLFMMLATFIVSAIPSIQAYQQAKRL